MKWKTIQSDTVYNSPFITVHKDNVETSDGVYIDDFYTVTVADAAAIVVLTPDN